MRSVDPKIYSRNYYLNSCSKNGDFSRFERLLKAIKFSKNMRILDLGCGRGDLAYYLARKSVKVVGIDYSEDAIKLAKKDLRIKRYKKNISFILMDAKKLFFPDNYFDLVISIDLFEHLYPPELEAVLKEVSRVLKKDGDLLVHTEANKIYLNITHKFYVYPVNALLVLINKVITQKEYPGLPKDPRSNLHKIQHVNEPTYLYLRNLFARHFFKGKIISVVPFKPLLGWKDWIYNLSVWFYPVSLFWPFNFLFAYDYFCFMKNKKEEKSQQYKKTC